MKAWLLVSAVLIIGSALANLDGVRDSIEWELHAVRMPGKDTTWHAVWQVGVGNR